MTFPPFHWWRTVFWLIPAIAVYTIVLGALSLTSMLVDRRGHFAHGCARLWSWLILATTGVRVRVDGHELVAPDQSYVFVSNHQSIYDFPILITSIPAQLRIIAKASLSSFPVLGWHLRYTGHLLIDRARAGRATLDVDMALEVAEVSTTLDSVAGLMGRGHSLIVFPEGTRSGDGKVRRFKRGLFSLAIEAGLPVVPVAVIGSRHVMRKDRLMTCPGDVELVIHEPLFTDGLARGDAGALAERVHDIIATAVRARQGVSDETPQSVPEAAGS